MASPQFPRAKFAALFLLLGAWVSPNEAAQTSGSFDVVVNISGANTGLCRRNTGIGTFGATVTVVCTTGAVLGLEAMGKGMPWLPVHGGAYRFLTHVSGKNQSGTVDSDTGAGTSAAFRVVSLTDQEYTELTISW